MKCFSRFVSLVLTAFFFLGPLSTAPLDAASYGSGKKSYSSSSSSRSSSSSSSRSSSSFSNRKSSSSSSSSSSRSSSSSFKSGSSSYNSGRSYSSPSSSSSGIRYDSDAAKAKKSTTTTWDTTTGRPVTSGRTDTTWTTTPSHSTTRSTYTSRPTPTPTPREQKFASYLTRRTVVYRDRYDSDFWWWLLDQPRPVRARWAYHHTNTMDPQRYEALMHADEGLQEEVTALELQKLEADSDYVPEGLQKHWMYSAFIPSSRLEHDAPAAVAAAPTPTGRFWFWFWMIGGGCFLIWLIFFKRWGGSPRAQFA